LDDKARSMEEKRMLHNEGDNDDNDENSRSMEEKGMLHNGGDKDDNDENSRSMEEKGMFHNDGDKDDNDENSRSMEEKGMLHNEDGDNDDNDDNGVCYEEDDIDKENTSTRGDGGGKEDKEIRIMIRRLMTEGMVMVLRMVKIITIRIIMTRNSGCIEKSYIDDNDKAYTVKEMVFLMRKVIMIIVIRIILTGEWSL
jgi:hypothetical protein